MKVTFKVSGLKEADEALARVLPSMRGRALRAAFVEASKPLLRDIKANAPVDTGDLKRSIKITNHPDGGSDSAEIKMQIGVVGEFYGHFQEFGTIKQPARPFVRPAWDRNSRELIALFAEYLRKHIVPGLLEGSKYRKMPELKMSDVDLSGFDKNVAPPKSASSPNKSDGPLPALLRDSKYRTTKS